MLIHFIFIRQYDRESVARCREEFPSGRVGDPGETRDLAKDQPEKLKELQAAWDRYAKDVDVVLSK